MKTVVDGKILEFQALDNLVASNLEVQTQAIKESFDKYTDLDTVILNLSNVNEIDSMGVNLVVGLYKQTQAKKMTFKVSNASRSIINLFNLFKLTSYFEVTS
ncbi:MAG: STAS domain-containing protein [Candidatus Cloacimonetes bacterium]|jgi:anti-sigma B factor antagonist|nr:STAS domain-containing protein [Candidatus Cloacimonadota bacterium]MDD4155204.1 STAS domain-containing protein [Candidatus Cloacimonadota bacterium]